MTHVTNMPKFQSNINITRSSAG